MRDDVVHPGLSYKINGLCFKVHNDLGRFRTEQTYSDAFEVELKKAGVVYIREIRLPSSFEGEKSGRNVPDFIIEGILVVDFKAKHHITREDYFQMRRYLSVLNLKLGLVVNFQQEHVSPKRVLNSSAST
ncbi:MAG: GxxExxY protein [Patescibacteria group bacterium]